MVRRLELSEKHKMEKYTSSLIGDLSAWQMQAKMTMAVSSFSPWQRPGNFRTSTQCLARWAIGQLELFGKFFVWQVGGDTIFNMLRLATGHLEDGDRPKYPHRIISCQVLTTQFVLPSGGHQAFSGASQPV